MSATATTGVPDPVCRQARCLANERLAAGSHCLTLGLPGPLPAAGPGQFAMLSLDHPDFPLLPRPFSLLGWESDAVGERAAPSVAETGEGRVEFLVMPVGRGSRALAALAPGDPVRLVGPLGRRLDRDWPAGGVICVAGGYGVAPFLFLCERLAREAPERLGATRVIYGARAADRLGLLSRLRASGVELTVATDDGSAGFAGRVDAALEKALGEGPVARVLTCGPDAMMEAVGHVCAAAGVPAWASLETVMGCGYAVCNGCAVALDDDQDPEGHGYELACREGTLFDTERLQWRLL